MINQEIKVGTKLTYTNGNTYEHLAEVVFVDGNRFLITEVKGHRHHLLSKMYIYENQIKSVL